MSVALFETERLVVRGLRRDDLDTLLAVYGDVDAMRWVGDGSPLSRGDALRWLDVTERNVATRGYGMCALVERATDAVVGFAGLVHPGGQPEAEIKYALARAHWGRGLATEAARGMLAWGVHRFGLQRVVATTAPENHASHRVLRKAGMSDAALRDNGDGSFTQWFEWTPPPHRVFVYGTLKEGFRNFHVNRGARVGGAFVTVQPYPLHVIGEFGLPWLVHAPGAGHAVRGQLFDVDEATLAAMDGLERIHDAQWYTRRALKVRPVEGGAELRALAYFGDAERAARETVHHGPLPEYLPEHQVLYRKHL
ncbi:MAG TPA: GNAT family N-acetyltransferase [Burkholderiaceae bacterium]|nr:GNAT family N-acetyltransferase [Burkholderiaceae bacterium]